MDAIIKGKDDLIIRLCRNKKYRGQYRKSNSIKKI